ncbi:hypothetical protein JTE90_014098 [Oedothorax gibbosus]|uniref:Uncharacterized protein n=1 Tax=Oedothorax gibbosus TaxID=931172 RepID=A0AAV6V6A4_9ARAC|nr:hypothetical protein JTE90_014098 [Oedothorax gibbosus]
MRSETSTSSLPSHLHGVFGHLTLLLDPSRFGTNEACDEKVIAGRGFAPENPPGSGKKIRGHRSRSYFIQKLRIGID